MKTKYYPYLGLESVTLAPSWLVKRMETLRQMPPPTLQKVRAQLKASAGVSKSLDAKSYAKVL